MLVEDMNVKNKLVLGTPHRLYLNAVLTSVTPHFSGGIEAKCKLALPTMRDCGPYRPRLGGTTHY